MTWDIVIRGGQIADGTGATPYRGDVAVDDGVIVEVGQVSDGGREEIDASDCYVTPGFIDVHTHYDGQAIWSDRLTPSSEHGVTTAVLGNCGVGFAPCRPSDHDLLVNAMEGVEDIPEVVMTTGLSWDWETFPEYLNALAARARDIDIAVYLPHSPLRVYAMGERGADRQVATEADIATMARLTAEAIDAGAVGFSTSRTAIHRRGDGEYIPSYLADEAELQGIAAGVGGRGVMQVVTNLTHEETDEDKRAEIGLLERISRTAGLPVTFTLNQQNRAPELFTRVLGWVDEANADPAVSLRPQYAPRPVGIYAGHELSVNPFSACPTYRKLAALPLPRRIEELRRPEIRARILAEQPSPDAAPIVLAARQFERTYVLTIPPTYEPLPSASVVALARARGVSAQEFAYDALLADEGRASLYVALSNYGLGNLDHVPALMRRAEAVMGLGDGGAHYGMICDASYPTFVLTHWARDRGAGEVPIGAAIRLLSSVPADFIGLGDRGRLAPGARADVNVIDHAALRLDMPEVAYDLPGGGRRIHQRASGYRATLVAGVPILRDDVPTGQSPGRLVRGARGIRR